MIEFVPKPRHFATVSILLISLVLSAATGCQPQNSADDSAKIFQALQEKDGFALGVLLAKNPDFGATNSAGETFLEFAIREDYVHGVSLLLAARAPVNVKKPSGETPLASAVEKRNMPIIALLLEAGAKPEPTVLLPAYANRDIDLAIIALLGGQEQSARLDNAGTPTPECEQTTVYVTQELGKAERRLLKQEITADLLEALQAQGDVPDTTIMKLRDIINEEKK